MQTDTLFKQSIQINASSAEVWKALTNIRCMERWITEEEIFVTTDWSIGNPLVLKGDLHFGYVENRGKVLKFNDGKSLSYTQVSSLSKLPDVPESYTLFEFELFGKDGATELELKMSNFPTDSIYRHLAFYWVETLKIIKDFIETKKCNNI